jgi:hypothetical protein
MTQANTNKVIVERKVFVISLNLIYLFVHWSHLANIYNELQGPAKIGFVCTCLYNHITPPKNYTDLPNLDLFVLVC